MQVSGTVVAKSREPAARRSRLCSADMLQGGGVVSRASEAGLRD